MYKEPKNIVEGADSLLQTIAEIESLATTAEEKFQQRLTPVRKSLIKRFPVIFLLLVTAGFAFVSFGIEEFLHSQAFLTKNPLLVFSVGLLLLIISGSAYKRH